MIGAGLPNERPRNPVAAMREAGAAFRAFVVGLRELLMVRDEVKSALGVDQTAIRRRDNNPLKFATGDEDALTALLDTGRLTSMTPRQAVEDALRNLRRHEQASLPAMQAAVRSLLDRLRPEVLMARVEAAESPLPAALTFALQRRARAWEAFEAEYKRIVGALDDDFDAVLGRRFAREYVRIVEELRAAEEERR
jgi:type VI secretion system FHA domain protein